jgi:tetratricopeptide (TPR) repeat protein
VSASAVADATALATEAWQLVLADPRRARELAEAALNATSDAQVRSRAHRALGMIFLEGRSADESFREMEASLAEAERAGDVQLAAEARMGLALALQHRGEARAAIRHADRAVAAAPTVPRLSSQRAQILERMGRDSDAIESYAEAERLASEQGDDLTLARVWMNRGVLWIYRAEFEAAELDLRRGEALCISTGQDRLRLMCVGNLGYLAGRQGKIVEALRRLDQVTPEMEAVGGLRLGVHELDRCEVLLFAGLAGDAVTAGQGATRVLGEAGMGIELAEARVITAQAALRNGDPATAERLAEAALVMFRRHRCPPWEALAREVIVRAEWQAGRRDAKLMNRARRVADDLEAARWFTSAASARIVSARLALELGHPARARNDLRRVNAPPKAPVALKIQARHAEALLLLAEGDTKRAQAKLRAGWVALEEHRATLGATELRVSAATHGLEISTLGLKLAVDDGSPADVFGWAERVRAGALHQPPATAPRDEPLAAALAELRVVAAEADDASKDGTDPRPALRRQAALEESVRRRAQIVPVREGGAPPVLDGKGLLEHLGEHVLIEFLEVEGQLGAVVARDGRWKLQWLAPAAAVEREIAALRMSLRRLALGPTVQALAVAAREAVRYSAEWLALHLLGPLANATDGRPLVVVPTGSLHNLPWSALAGTHASLVVAPSATLWLRGHLLPPVGPAAQVLLVAGPRLKESDAEISDLAALYPGASVLRSQDATVERVRDGLSAACMAHLACHGNFRDDNPLFSSLELADGALSVFEFEDLPSVPRRIVLSACSAGRSAVQPGNEVLGLTAAVLRIGTQSLVASTLPVPDGASRRLMGAMHRAMAGGAGVAESLGKARADADLERDDDLVATAAFTVFGSG